LWRFTEERDVIAREKSKSNWNTDDFFQRTWIDMPPFENRGVPVYHTVTVTFPKLADKIAFAELVKQPISENTKSIDFPFLKTTEKRNLVWIGRKETSQPRYPVFIVSKGRAQYGPLTAIALREIGVPFYLMVEPQEYDKYRVLCDWAEDVFVLPEGNHGKGPGRARNACWDIAKKVMKTKRHWVLDDNIRAFYRLHQNQRIRVGDGTIFRAAEDFVDRYKNIPIAGFAYKFFHPATETQFPFKVNTRIYSTLLIDNDCPYRWRGRYNEDTILSLDVLKDVKNNPTHEDLNAVNEDGTLKNSKRERYATVEFITFLQDKLNTQTQKGGNTAEFYHKEGTAAKSAMLVDIHPDVAEAKEAYDRDHHKVKYEVFRGNWLIRTEERKAELKKRSWKPLKDKNPYGMKLVESSFVSEPVHQPKPISEISEERTLREIDFRGRVKALVRDGTSDEFVVREVFSGAYSKLNLKPSDVVLDIGLNIGMFSCWALAAGAKKVFGYEPDAENFSLARRNLSLNGITKACYTIERRAVVGNDDSVRSFFINGAKNKGAHTLIETRGRTSIDVKCVNINAVLKELKPTVVKIDCEGGEYEIICAIKSFRCIRELIFEFHHTVLKDTKTREKYHHLLEILKKHFRTVEYRQDPKGAWVSNVYCRK
jgi:FkbM family methyltransferase